MKTLLGILAASLIFVLGIIGLSWLSRDVDYRQNKYYMPKEEQVRRQTFEQSKAYNAGMVQELENMQFQYEQADPNHKAVLRSVILHRVSEYGEDNLPPNLATFVNKLRVEQ